MENNNPLRIAFLHHAGSTHVVARAKYFLNQGHIIHYLGFLPTPLKGEVPDQIKVLDLLITWSFFKYLGYVQRLLGFHFKIRKYIRENSIDVLHIMGMGYAIYAVSANSKCVIIEHMGSDVLVSPINNTFLKILYRIFYKFTDGVIQDSYIAQDAGIRLGAPVKENHVIEVGVDFNFFNSEIHTGKMREKLGLVNEDIIFSPRGADKLYNHDVLLRAIPDVLKKHPRAKFVFCRDRSGFIKEHQDLINQLGIQDAIVCIGFLNKESELPTMFRDANVIISIPSTDSSPLTVYEAMACKTPVVLSKLPWYDRKLKEDIDFFSVEVGGYNELSKKIIQILEGTIPNVESAYNEVFLNRSLQGENKKLESLYYRLQ